MTIRTSPEYQIQRMAHRGVTFVIEGNTGAGYAWSIHPISRTATPALGGRVAGASAFRRAVNGAQRAIDAWLLNHPEDGSEES